MNNYLDYSDRDDVLSGGVKLIPVDTLKGTFRVWTKRVGNNPTAHGRNSWLLGPCPNILPRHPTFFCAFHATLPNPTFLRCARHEVMFSNPIGLAEKIIVAGRD